MTPEPGIEILYDPIPVIRPLLLERAHLQGVICEFGCYAGATTFQLAEFGRLVYAFDTFTGIPHEDFSPELDHDLPGKFQAPRGLYGRMVDHPLITPIMGRFEKTLPRLQLPVVLAYLDADLYASTVTALHWLAHNLVPGAAIVLDDYATHAGVRMAVNAFLASHPSAVFNGSQVITWP